MASEANVFKQLFTSHGLRVSEDTSRILALDGKTIVYHVVSGIREGVYKISIRLSPSPKQLTLIVNASNESEAANIALELEELGFNVDVDGERVHATAKAVSLDKAKSAMRIAEKAVQRG